MLEDLVPLFAILEVRAVAFATFGFLTGLGIPFLNIIIALVIGPNHCAYSFGFEFIRTEEISIVISLSNGKGLIGV